MRCAVFSRLSMKLIAVPVTPERNRLNVAISRARCLAYVVASPKLLEVGCRSIEQMRMANALCLFAEEASRQ